MLPFTQPYCDTLEIVDGAMRLKAHAPLSGRTSSLLHGGLLTPPPAPKPAKKAATALDLEADAPEICRRLLAIVRAHGGRVAMTMAGLHRVGDCSGCLLCLHSAGLGSSLSLLDGLAHPCPSTRPAPYTPKMNNRSTSSATIVG